MSKIKTGINSIDLMTDGGLSRGTITQVFGEKALGKSIISFQIACNNSLYGSSSVIIDTEQSYSSYLLPYWKERLEKKFGKKIEVKNASIVKETGKKSIPRSKIVSAIASAISGLEIKINDSQISEIAKILLNEVRIDVERTESGIIMLEVPDITDLLLIHGYDTSINVTDAGRVEVRLRRSPFTPALQELVEKTNAGLIVYDSISAPFKSIFSSTADLPARSSCLAMILTTAQRLCSSFSLSVLATSHTSINPIQAWDRRPFGGAILAHEAKFSFELTRQNAKRYEGSIAVNPEEKRENSRIVWSQRHPAHEDYSFHGYYTITDEGVV